MKKSITVLVLLAVGLMHAQAFKGKGDVKFDVGANFQEGGSGILFLLIWTLEKTCHMGLLLLICYRFLMMI
jgi:hypothetical protein